MSKWKQFNFGKVKQMLLAKKPQPEAELRLAIDGKSRQNPGWGQILKFKAIPKRQQSQMLLLVINKDYFLARVFGDYIMDFPMKKECILWKWMSWYLFRKSLLEFSNNLWRKSWIITSAWATNRWHDVITDKHL